MKLRIIAILIAVLLLFSAVAEPAAEIEEALTEIPEIETEIPEAPDIVNEPEIEAIGETDQIIPASDESAEMPSSDQAPLTAEAFANANVNAALNKTRVSVCAGDTGTTLNVIFSDGNANNTDGTERTVVFSSSNEECVLVSEAGNLTGVATGNAVINAAVTYEGKTETLICKVSVLAIPGSVSLTPAEAVIATGTKDANVFETVFAEGCGATCTYTSSDPEVATVDEDGMITAVKAGTTTISVKTFNGLTAEASLTVCEPAASVNLSENELHLLTGTSHALTCTLTASESDIIEWTSSDPEVVSVSDSGLVTAVNDGTAVITATAKCGRVSDSCTVTATAEAKSIVFKFKSLTIGKGNTFDLEALGLVALEPDDGVTTLTYKSGKPSVVSVNGSTLKAVKTGKAVITVTSSNGLTQKLSVTVMKYPSKMTLSRKTLTLGVHMSSTVSVSFGKYTYSGYTYSSDNPDVATVDPLTGEITGVSAGTCTITCKCLSGSLSAACTVTVLPVPDSVTIENDSISSYAGKKGLFVTGVCPEGFKCNFVYSVVSGDDVVDIDAETGALTLKKEGEAIVRATALNNPSAVADCAITVVPAPENIILSAATFTIGKGNTLDLFGNGIVSLTPENARTDFTFTSSSKNYVSVSAAGVIKGVKAGSAKITVSTANGIKKTITVKVLNYPTSMKLNKTSVVLSEKMSDKLTVSFNKNSTSLYSYTSSDPSIVTVDAGTGEIYAVSAGTAVITCACTTGKLKATCTVNVLPEPTEITVSPTASVIGKGDTITLTVQLNNDCTGSYTFESLNPDIAIVDPATGVVTAGEIGSAVIRVTAYNGITKDVSVSIIEAPANVTLTNPAPEDDAYKITLNRSESFQITADISPYTHLGITYSSSNPAVASVDATGLIKTSRGGSAKITVSAYNGVCAEIELTVLGNISTTEKFMISHALGGIGGYAYSNSLEAFKENYAEGHRVFEIDISYTKDGYPVLWHDWNKRISSSYKAGTVLTLAQFKKTKIYDKYTPVTLDGLLQLMAKYPNITVITDSKDTSASGSAKFIKDLIAAAKKLNCSSVLDRFTIQVYNQKMFKAVDAVHHFSSYIYTVYQEFSKQPTLSQIRTVINFCANNGIDMVTMPYGWWSTDFLPSFTAADITVAVHTINSANLAQTYFDQGITAIYTDTLPPI